MSKKRLLLVDASGICYRAFYGLQGLVSSSGQPTNAVYGFVTMLNKIVKRHAAQYLAVCFDVSRHTFRQKKYAEYKIQRPPMPDGLSSQMPYIKQIVDACGFMRVEKEGYEADDIIATLAKKAVRSGFSVEVFSSDKDMLQLVDAHTQVISLHKDEEILYDKKMVEARFGVAPKEIPELIALMGDDADNIPGVRGIGEKTAARVLKDCGSLKKLFAHPEVIKEENIRKAIMDSHDQITLNVELASLDTQVALECGIADLKVKAQETQELFRLFKELEFKSLLKSLNVHEARAPVTFKAAKDFEIKKLLDKEQEVIISGSARSGLCVYAGGEYLYLEQASTAQRWVLEDRRVKKFGHDLKDLKVTLAQEGIVLEGIHFDTMIAAYLLNPSRASYSLSDIVLDYLGQSVPESLEKEDALPYLVRLIPVLKKNLIEKSLWQLFCDLEMPLVEVLADMQLKGIKLDLALLARLSREVEKKLISLIENIYALSGSQFNINSTKQLREVLFQRLKLPVIRKGKTGPSTDEEVLRSLSEKHQLPAVLLEYRQLTKLKNTYIDTLPALADTNKKIHTCLKQTGTETGRLSSLNPNLQNIPIRTDIGKVIRQAIVVSGAKRFFLSCDYSQIELRILAHLCKDKALIQAFHQGKDIHVATAALIHGLEEKEVSSSMRDTAKRVNFGIIYGLTSFGLSRDLKISIDAAQSFIDAYFARYPGVKEYIQEQIEKAQKDGFVTTLLGRRRYIPEINNKNQGIRQFAQRQAVNTPIQGSASDLIKLAMVDIHSRIVHKGLKAEMVLQIHDELLFDSPENELPEVAALVRERMENVMSLEVPLKVDIKKGKNWLEMEEVK
ncbi:MAG: DNA polymerase I [Candidatus Omnitrophica bacterium]|nr:DNA polymerase I [Candidatus Omnitrophota bacterium]